MKLFILYYFNVRTLLLLAVIIFISSCDKEEDKGNNLAVVDFSFNDVDIIVGDTVAFVNLSSGTTEHSSYLWDFGDGNTSTMENPSHVYEELGVYLVNLTVSDGTNSVHCSQEITVSLSNVIANRLGLREHLANLGDTILVCAHRGNHLTHPENSIAAIQASIGDEIAIVEIDVRQSKDGEMVLMHDATIDRTSSGSGSVNDLTLSELKEFYLELDGNLTSQQIPTFAEILQLSRGKIYLDLDVKMENFIKVYNMVKLYGMVDQVMFTIDDIADAKSLINNDNSTILMPSVRTQDDFDVYTNANLNLSVLHYNDDTFVEKYISQAEALNLKVFRLIYVNSSTTPDSDSYKQIDNLIDLAGSIVQTDYPLQVKSYLKSKKLN